jgi:hypothetical protein
VTKIGYNGPELLAWAMSTMSRDRIDQRITGPNALASQYKGDDIGPGGDLCVSYVSNETGAVGLRGVFGFGFTEQLPSLIQSETGAAH